MVFIGVMVCVFVASICQAMTGFGFALVVVPLIGLFWDLKAAVIVSVLVSPVASVPAALELRAHADRPMVGGLLAGSLIGAPLGTAVLVLASSEQLRVVIAAVLIVITIATLAGLTIPQTRRPLLSAFGVGVVSGVLRNATSMGGAPSAIYLLGLRYKAERFVGTNALYVVLGGGVAWVTVGIGGQLLRERIVASALSLPLLFLGAAIGQRLRQRLSERQFRFSVGTVLISTNAVALAPTLLRWL